MNEDPCPVLHKDWKLVKITKKLNHPKFSLVMLLDQEIYILLL